VLFGKGLQRGARSGFDDPLQRDVIEAAVLKVAPGGEVALAAGYVLDECAGVGCAVFGFQFG